jgi:hypothetical protein
MDLADLSSRERDALRRVLAYAVDKWDRESPTLFGLDKQALQEVLDGWPSSSAASEPTAARAIWEPLNYFVNGIGLRDAELQAQFGLSRSECLALMTKLRSRVAAALERPPVQTVLLGDTAIDIPAFLTWRDDDGTLVAYVPNTDYANLRFSLLSVTNDAGNYVPGAGTRSIMRRCKEAGAALQDEDGKVWFYSQAAASEGSPGSLVHFWHVGMDAHVLVISCFIDSAEAENPAARKVLASVPATIDSFRRAQDA